MIVEGLFGLPGIGTALNLAIRANDFPVIYGSVKAGCTFVEHNNLQFTLSEHYLFNKNQNCLRVIEGFDVMSTDTGAYIYGSFTATPASTTTGK